jgi:hypothetical protein
MSASRAFAIYSVVANLAYFLGGFGADLLRRFFGWQGLFGVGAFCTLVATAATLWLREPQTTGSRHRDEAIPLGLSAWGLLAAVAAYFLASAQFQTVLPLVVEAETVSGGWLRAGSLGAVHGLGVLCLTLGQSARSGSEGSPMVLACGIAVIGACFWLLAILHYPTTPSWILVVVALMSAGETLVGAHMLALGSRLAGLGRSAYWLASALGYCASAVWAVKWHAMSHASFFAAVAAACVLVSLWVLLAFRKR